jgi:hypothetical protein
VPDSGEADSGAPDPGEADSGAPDPGEADPGEADPGEADPGVPDPGGGAGGPELRVRRVRGEDADERELAPAVRVRVDGLAVPGDAALGRVEDRADADDPDLARVEDPADREEVALGLAADFEARSTSCSRARTRCWRRATSSRVAMPRTPS